MANRIVSKILMLKSHKPPNSSPSQFLREHVIFFILWTLQLFPFISEAACRQFLKNNNCCFLEQVLINASFKYLEHKVTF